MIASGTKLANGLELQIDDQTRRYFGDYHRVKLNVTAQIPLTAVVGLTPAEQELAARLLPEMVSFSKTLEKMAVGSAEVPAAREDLQANFSTHTLSYLASDNFPALMVRSALKKKSGSGKQV